MTKPTSRPTAARRTYPPLTGGKRVKDGDVAPVLTADGVRRHTVGQAIEAAQESELAALHAIEAADGDGPSVRAILDGDAPDDARRMRARSACRRRRQAPRAPATNSPSDWRAAAIPTSYKMLRRTTRRRSSGCRPSCSSCRPG